MTGISQIDKYRGQSLEEEGVEKHQGDGIGEAVEVARGEVDSVPDTGVPKVTTTEGRVESNNEGDQSKRGVCGKEVDGTEGVGRLDDNQSIESRGEAEEVSRRVTVLAEIDQNTTCGGKKTGNGTWKRRARQVGKCSRKKGDQTIGMECDSDNHAGKRRFYLRDEETPGKGN